MALTQINPALFAGATNTTAVIQSNGTTAITVDASQKVSFTNPIQGGSITTGTSVASTSGTSIDFTSIPSWVKRLTVILSGVSTNGASIILCQLGAGSVQTTGYVSTGGYTGSPNASGVATSTSGMVIFNGSNPEIRSGIFTFCLISSNKWVLGGCGSFDSGSYMTVSGGNVTLSGTLDRVRITTANGTDTFDAGSINILYEG
jgi:hypothetical protein